MLRFIFIVALLGTWFMPLIVAALYKLPHQGPIAVLSLLLGWTGVGWLAALVIAVGGAIRATRPALAGQAQPLGSAPGQPYPAPEPHVPVQPAWPAAATSPERVQSAERAQPPPAPPSWPDNPR